MYAETRARPLVSPQRPLPASGFPSQHAQQLNYNQQQQYPQPPPQRHKGTLAPGQKVRVGGHSVKIERYLSEGGYAHVYLSTSETPIYPPNKNREKKGRWGERGYTQHCLKRIAFQDDAVWVDVKKEIEVMKSLPSNSHLTQYLASEHTRLPNGHHEVFILMEFCAGGGIIDLLNRRLRDRLKEIEILNIFTDVCEAVAAMHSLKQPLLHRDLKIENVLSQPLNVPSNPQRPMSLIFKLCDFGSTTFPADRPPQSKIEADALAMDLNRHTTLQYRSPEMVEPMLGLPVGLPSDVWALGCLLYKLCYYTTPFEEHGPLAIVNAKYTFPPVPRYSPRLQHLIASMLIEQPVRRPTVFEVLKVAHEMSGTKPEIDHPIPPKVLTRTTTKRSLPNETPSKTDANLLDFTDSPSNINKTPAIKPLIAPSLQPQRRGRPTRGELQSSPRQQIRSSQPHTLNQGWQQQAASSKTQVSLAALTPLDVKSTMSRHQVDGNEIDEKSPRMAPSASKSLSLDAFGIPTSSTSPRSMTIGFEDSFGVSSFKSSSPMRMSQSSSGPYDSNSSKRLIGIGNSLGSSDLSRAASITSRAYTKSATEPMSRGTTRSIQSAGLKQPISTVPSRSAKSSSIPEGDTSFEARFPSIERLNSDGALSPSKKPTFPIVYSSSSNTPPNAAISFVSPQDRPVISSRPSLLSNLSGGNLKSPIKDVHRQGFNEMAQARSTQVTGTAFRNDVSSFMSNTQATKQQQELDYLDNVEKVQHSQMINEKEKQRSPIKKKTLENLMDKDDSAGLQVPILPARSSSPASIASLSSETSRMSRNELPRIDWAKTDSNIMSDKWSPLQDLKRDVGLNEPLWRGGENASVERKKMRSSDPEVDSSDDEGPEDPGSVVRLPSTQVQSLFPKKGSSPVLPTKASSSSTSGAAELIGRPASQRIPSSDRIRPQSMFLPTASSCGSRDIILSPSLPSEPSLVATSSSNSPPAPINSPPAASRVRSRAGSINGIVNRYESLGLNNKPSKDSERSKRPDFQNNSNSSMVTNAIERKPSVAYKPLALRKSLLDTEKPVQSAPLPQHPAVETTQPKPVKSVNVQGLSRVDGYARPEIIERPNVKLEPTTYNSFDGDNDTEAKSKNSEHQLSPKSISSSPEKQQPVNLLIQRWNTGQVNNSLANAPKPKRGNYI
ncbi:hypothetical protein L204_101568 [Cryptococcus depauperatus]|nr:NAK protein kinase [Cryptococcus depauperatus CBS 7855]